jgi:hypothetical protein
MSKFGKTLAIIVLPVIIGCTGDKYSQWIENPAKIGKAVIGEQHKTEWGIAAENRPKDTDSTYGIGINTYIAKMSEYNPNIKNHTVHVGDTVCYPIYDKLEKQKFEFRKLVSGLYKNKHKK